MSIIKWAKDELKQIDFGEEDTAVMLSILEKFFAQWDSGKASAIAIPILQRLLTVKALSPLTGEENEWQQVGEGVWQNKRTPSIFKDDHYYEGKLAYDLDNPNGHRTPLEFPYYPAEIREPRPIVILDENK